MAKRWWFSHDTQARPARWEWRLLAADGSIERKSRPFASYGQAVRDAIIHGFRPTEDHWVIESTHLVSHYENGRQSLVLDKGGRLRR